MDTHPDDLSELERQLVDCVPSPAALDADAMLFAAGRATARPRPAGFFWPTLSAGLAALATVLGLWVATERSERFSLVQQLKQLTSSPIPAPSPIPTAAPTVDELAPNSILAARRALEQGLDAWPPVSLPRADRPSAPLPDAPILRVGRANSLPDL